LESKNARVDGIVMRWDEVGDGTPVVFVHGVPTDPSLWRNVLPLVQGARCLAWEMVGYGNSIPEGRGRNISVAHQAEYLVAWLRTLGLTRVILAGHDLGGGVVQIAATRHPEACAGLFLTNAIGYDSWPIPSVNAMKYVGGIARRLPDSLFEMIFRSFLYRGHDTSDLADAAFEAHWPAYERHGAAEAFVRQIEALHTQDTLDVAESLPRLGVPARIAWGTGDAFQKIEYGERFAKDLDAPLRRIEGARHFTPEDHPDIIASQVSQLVADVNARTFP